MGVTTARRALSESKASGLNVNGFSWKEQLLPQTEKPAPSILVADGNDANRRLVCNILADEGFKAVPARDGREARQILQASNHFMAAIFEIVIPHVSGPDLARFMKREQRLKGIPVIMMTRTSSARMSCESFAAGASVLVPEPFGIRQMRNLVRMVVDKKSDQSF